MNIITSTSSSGHVTYKTTLVPGSHVIVEAFFDGRFVSMRKFEIGDVADFGWYNHFFTGRIVSIGKSMITIDKGYGSKNRLKAEKFAYRNWYFDAAEMARRNAEIDRHI